MWEHLFDGQANVLEPKEEGKWVEMVEVVGKSQRNWRYYRNVHSDIASCGI